MEDKNLFNDQGIDLLEEVDTDTEVQEQAVAGGESADSAYDTNGMDGAAPVYERRYDSQTGEPLFDRPEEGENAQSAAAPHWNFDQPAAAEPVAFEEPQNGGKKKKNKNNKNKGKKGFGQFVKYAALGLVFGVAACGGFWGINALSGYKAFGGGASANAPAVTIGTVENVSNQSGSADNVSNGSVTTTVTDVSGVVENVMPSVVSIYNKGTTSIDTFWGTQTYESSSSGSGIIVGQNDTELLIATNNHVVSGADSLTVKFSDDSEVAAAVKGTTSEMDLAVVAVKLSDVSQETKSTVKVAKLGDSSVLKVGEPAIAIGNALGYGQSVTTGVISAVDREIKVKSEDNGGTEVIKKLIQTDAAINPGNSGGALLNINGEVIGINSAKYSSTQVEGMGYAIPISEAQPILDEMMSGKTRTKLADGKSAAIGITGADVTSDAMKRYGMPAGAYVAKIIEGGAAEKAGIQQGDIIIKMDGQSISSMKDLTEQLKYYEVGEKVDFVVERYNSGQYQEVTVNVTLEEKSKYEDDADDDQDEEEEDTTQATEQPGLFWWPF